MNTLGIDPGLKGAIAMLDSDGQCVAIYDLPTLRTTKSRREICSWDLVGLFEDLRADYGEFRVVIEQASTRPGQSASSGLKTGFGFGLILGILAAQKVSVERISPQRWQRFVLGQIDRGTAKDRSRSLAQQLYPMVDLGRRKTQDRSDALLIALYGHRTWNRDL